MTQDEILEALHKVVQENKHYTTWTVSTPHLVALVKLAIEHEREECAMICEKAPEPDGAELAERIRERGKRRRNT